MTRRTTQDKPPTWAKLCPTSGTFNKIAGSTQWPGGPAWYISQAEHFKRVEKLTARIAELEGKVAHKG